MYHLGMNKASKDMFKKFVKQVNETDDGVWRYHSHVVKKDTKDGISNPCMPPSRHVQVYHSFEATVRTIQILVARCADTGEVAKVGPRPLS